MIGIGPKLAKLTQKSMFMMLDVITMIGEDRLE